MSGLTAPMEWADKARHTLDKVRAAMAASSKRVFTEHWTDDEVRNLLLALVGRKCWYCETTIQRADANVDHFRPKSEVLGEVGHDGYWWLAYQVDNYRIACKHCNSGGARFGAVPEGRAKSTRFPLLAGPRARRPGDDLSLEQPLLLDPARPGDPDLLGFDSSGHARRSAIPYSPIEARSGVCRADETIRILALNATQITEQRRALMEEVTALVRISGLPGVQELIAKKVCPTAQWSAAAIAALTLQKICALPMNEPATPAAAHPNAPPLDPSRSKVDLQQLLTHLDPAELKAGITLTGQHNKRVYRAILQRDGRISVLGRAWGTPTTAARVATGSDDVDGWEFWRLTIADVEQSLADFRDTHGPSSALA